MKLKGTKLISQLLEFEAVNIHGKVKREGGKTFTHLCFSESIFNDHKVSIYFELGPFLVEMNLNQLVDGIIIVY